jgi:outer membrane immunogenic protein
LRGEICLAFIPREGRRRCGARSCIDAVALKGTASGGGVNASLTQNTTPSGWTIGGGAELALGPNWSARLEYLYVDLGTVNNTVVVTSAPSLTDSARVQMNVVRAGVNYRF